MGMVFQRPVRSVHRQALQRPPETRANIIRSIAACLSSDDRTSTLVADTNEMTPRRRRHMPPPADSPSPARGGGYAPSVARPVPGSPLRCPVPRPGNTDCLPDRPDRRRDASEHRDGLRRSPTVLAGVPACPRLPLGRSRPGGARPRLHPLRVGPQRRQALRRQPVSPRRFGSRGRGRGWGRRMGSG